MRRRRLRPPFHWRCSFCVPPRYRLLATHSAVLLVDRDACRTFLIRSTRERDPAHSRRAKKDASSDSRVIIVESNTRRAMFASHSLMRVRQRVHQRAHSCQSNSRSKAQLRRRSTIVSERSMGLAARLLWFAIVTREFVSRFSSLSLCNEEGVKEGRKKRETRNQPIATTNRDNCVTCYFSRVRKISSSEKARRRRSNATS